MRSGDDQAAEADTDRLAPDFFSLLVCHPFDMMLDEPIEAF